MERLLLKKYFVISLNTAYRLTRFKYKLFFRIDLNSI